MDSGAKGLAYIAFEKNETKIISKGPIAKFFSQNALDSLVKDANVSPNDCIFFISDKYSEAIKFAGLVRTKIGTDLKLIDEDQFNFLLDS